MGECGMSGKFSWIDVYSGHRSMYGLFIFLSYFSFLSSECWFLF